MKMYFSQDEQTEWACVLFQIVSINVLKTSVKCFRPNLIESHYRILSKVSFLLMYHFCIVKKNGLNFLLRIIFVLPFYDLEQSPVITKPCLVNLPPIIFCARFEFTWIRKSPNFNKI